MHQPEHPLRAKPRAVRALLTAACAVSLALAASACSVPGIFVAEKKGLHSATGFDAATWADANWSKTVVQTVTAKAADITAVVAAIKADSTAASAKYGVRVSDGGTYSFPVKGTGEVLGLQDPTGQGVLDLKVDGLPAGVNVGVVVGPVFLGTALRDAAHIEFGQFTNQTDYLGVALAINKEVPKRVIKGLDLPSLKGKQVSFVGAFQLLDPQNLLVTPVSLEVK